MPTHVVNGSFYEYNPSKVAPFIFAILYLIVTIVSIYQTIRTRASVWSIFVLASIMETVGYAAKIQSVKHVDDKNPFVVSFVLIILAPVVIAAAMYILFGRIVFYVTPPEKQNFRFLWMPPRFLTLIFVCFDLLAFATQGIGATEVGTGSTKHTVDQGKTIVLIGLGIQLVAFGFFSIIGIRFNLQSRHFPRHGSGGPSAAPAPANPRWMGLLIALNVACGLILVRSIYRVVEFAGGVDGYVSVHEWPTYLFDALPIFPIFVLMCLMPPARYVPYMSWRVPRKQLLQSAYQLESA